MGIWIIWLIVAAVLGVAEVMTARLAFGLLAVAALVGAGVGAAGGNVPLQFGAFVVEKRPRIMARDLRGEDFGAIWEYQLTRRVRRILGGARRLQASARRAVQPAVV